MTTVKLTTKDSLIPFEFNEQADAITFVNMCLECSANDDLEVRIKTRGDEEVEKVG